MAKIFVYGTLRKGMYNYDLYLKKEDSFREYAYIKGSLHTIVGKVYPAYLCEGHQMIIGEIHEVSDETLKAVDEMEGYKGENLPENEYNKILCPIYNQNGEEIMQLPVFVFNMQNPLNASILGDCIESGDYVLYMKQLSQ